MMLSLLTAALAAPAPFEASLEAWGLRFEAPSEWTEVPASENPHMSWDHALRSPDGLVEARFALRDARGVYEHLQACQADEDCVGAAPEPLVMVPATFMATCANISGGQMATPARFPDHAVRKEFNAPFGWTDTVGPLRKDWGAGFAQAMTTVIHRDGIEAWAFYLFDDFAKAEPRLREVFHALTFAPLEPDPSEGQVTPPN